MRFLIVAALALAPALAHAQTSPSVRDIVELSKAGLGQEVLLALIDVHRPVFPIDAETLKMLKTAGVPAPVIVAMVKSGREPLPEPPAPVQVAPPDPPPPQVIVVDRDRDEPRVREVAVPVPVYVPVPTRRPRYDDHPRPDPKPVAPVYWGWGGKLRPDAWQPAPQKDPRHKDTPPPKEPRKQ